jgi:hypothetical protein
VIIRKPVSKGVRLLAAALFVLGVMVSVSAATQSAALAAGCSPSGNNYPTANCYNYSVSHVCEEISPSGDADQANICTDIYTSWTQASATSSGSFDIWGVGEYYCQGASAQCKGINGQNSLAISEVAGGSGSFSESSRDYTCSTTACPDGGRAQVATAHLTGTIPSAIGAMGKPNQCFTVTATVSSGDAILTNDAGSAYHAAKNFSTTATICYVNG